MIGEQPKDIEGQEMNRRDGIMCTTQKKTNGLRFRSAKTAPIPLDTLDTQTAYTHPNPTRKVFIAFFIAR